MPEKYLVHHGIKGMKWGKRRFQNKDGSLTPAGQRRYNDDSGSSDSSNSSTSQYRAVPSYQYKLGVTGRQGTSTSERRRRNSRSSRESNWIIKGDNGEIIYTQRARFNSAKGQSSLDSKRVSSVNRNGAGSGSSTGGGATVKREYETHSGVSVYDDARKKAQNERERGKSPYSVTGYDPRKAPFVVPSARYADAIQNPQRYRSKDYRFEKSNTKKDASSLDWWENTATDKQRQQIFNNSDRAYNQKRAQEDPEKRRESLYNPSKVRFSISSPYQEALVWLDQKHNTRRGIETPGTPSQNNPARYGNFEQQRRDAVKASKSKAGTKKSSLTTKVTQTISQATQQASQSVQKASNWLKKLFGKK